MNASVENGDSIPVLTEGGKGAEAYAFNGKWMIVTPVLKRASASLTMDYNIPDAPAVYYANYLRGYLTRDDITLPDERILLAYFTNQSAIATYRSYLNNKYGECWGAVIVPSGIGTEVYSVVRNNLNMAYYASLYGAICTIPKSALVRLLSGYPSYNIVQDVYKRNKLNAFKRFLKEI